MLSPLWLFIWLLEAPEGIYAVFWFGLVTGASEMHSKQERKKKPINESQKTHTKCEKSFKFAFYVVTYLFNFLYLLSKFQNNVLNATEYGSFRYFLVAYGAIICLVWRSQRSFTVSRQTAWQFTVSRQKMLYSTVNRQKCSLRLTLKKFLGISNLSISAELDGIPAPKDFLNWKNQFSCQKKTFFLDNTVPYNLLISENILKFGKWKAKTTSKHIRQY